LFENLHRSYLRSVSTSTPAGWNIRRVTQASRLETRIGCVVKSTLPQQASTEQCALARPPTFVSTRISAGKAPASMSFPARCSHLRFQNGERWTDWKNECGADGYNSNWLLRPWETFRRVPQARWFQLICTIGKSIRSPLVIGSHSPDFLPSFPSRFYLFANDLPLLEPPRHDRSQNHPE